MGGIKDVVGDLHKLIAEIIEDGSKATLVRTSMLLGLRDRIAELKMENEGLRETLLQINGVAQSLRNVKWEELPADIVEVINEDFWELIDCDPPKEMGR